MSLEIDSFGENINIFSFTNVCVYIYMGASPVASDFLSSLLIVITTIVS